jgi:hypothetical protein
MKSAALLVLVAACGPGDNGTNPAVLWLAPKNGETEVTLQADEPSPF